MRRVLVSQDLLQNLYVDQGLTTYQIAEKLGFCQGTIWKRLCEYGIKSRLPYVPVNFSKKQLKSWYIDQKLSTWEIEKRFGYSRGTLYRKLKEFGFQTRNIATSHIRFSREDFSGDILEKAYLVGFRIGDLNVTKCGPKSETIAIKCASTKQGQLELFKNLFSHYGHIIEGKPTKEGKINIQANLNPSFSFLLDKRPNSYEWVFKNKKTFFAFLAGFSDAEGSFFISDNQGRFALGNYNKNLLLNIKNNLFKFGIPTLLYTHYRKGRMFNGYVSRNHYHILCCGRKVYVLKLLDELFPYLKHPDKLQDAQKVRENILKRNEIFGNLKMD